MEIRRAKNPVIIKHLRPFFIEDGAFNRDVIAKELFDKMVSIPDKIFVVIIFEGDELRGFGIAWVPINREYVWLAQAWSKPGSDRDYGEEAINMIKQWAVSAHNLHEMRFETNRNPKAIERVWGFKIHSTVMRDKF